MLEGPEASLISPEALNAQVAELLDQTLDRIDQETTVLTTGAKSDQKDEARKLIDELETKMHMEEVSRMHVPQT